jgi:hypothetical protein
MRKLPPIILELGRVTGGPFGSTSDDGMAGAFQIRSPKDSPLAIMSSGVDQQYWWEHVSVSTHGRTPFWEEMCFVKDLFWEPEECVIQFHPPISEYVNHHPNCLHLWRPLRFELITPPSILVGPRDRRIP